MSLIETRDSAPAATPALLPFVVASAAVSAIVATTVAWFVWSGRWMFLDDAYITMHSARVLWEGVDRAYPGTPALVGITSPVHLAIVAALMPLDGPETATLVTLWLATMAYGIGAGVLARAYGLSLGQAVACTVIALTVGFMPSQLANGLETALAVALVTWVLVLASNERGRDGVVLYVLAGLAPFVRPELGLLTLAVGIGRVMERPRDAARIAAIVGLSALPLAGWMLYQTGGVLPTTIGAKQAFFAEEMLPLGTRMTGAVVSVVAFCYVIGALSAGAVGLWRSRAGRVSLSCVLLVIAAYTLRLPSALHHYDGRYLYPFVPVLLAGLMLIVAAHRSVGRALLLLAITHNVALLSPRVERIDGWSSQTREARMVTSEWLRQAEVSGKVVVHDAGFLSEHTGLELIDMVGLKTPSSIAIHNRVTLPSGGRDRTRAIAEIISQANAHYVVASDSFLPGVEGQLRNLGWRVDQLSPAPSGHWSYYRVLRVFQPERRIS